MYIHKWHNSQKANIIELGEPLDLLKGPEYTYTYPLTRLTISFSFCIKSFENQQERRSSETAIN